MHQSVEQAPTGKGEATRRHIVEQAARLILADGVANTTIQDVRCAAGVSASQIYHHFGSKQGLVESVIAMHAAQRVEEANLPPQLDSVEGLRRWAQRAVEIQIERGFVGGCELGSLASQLAETGPDVRTALATAFERWEAPLRHALLAMHDRGELGAGADPRELALAFTAALQGGTLLAQVKRDATPLRVALDTVLNQISDATGHS